MSENKPSQNPASEEHQPVPKTKKSTENKKPRQTNDRLQVLANVLTILVALAAIGLSIWEGMENRLHNRLSVLPHLERVESSYREGVEDSTYTLKYALYNSGLGPAVLQNVLVYKDSIPIFNAIESGKYIDFAGVIDELEALPFYVSIFTQSRRAGEMLQAGEEHLLMQLETPVLKDNRGLSTTQIVREQVLDRYSLVFCYCSIYGDHCNATYLSAKPPNTNACSL